MDKEPGALVYRVYKNGYPTLACYRALYEGLDGGGSV
jgi:hypothetical protein